MLKMIHCDAYRTLVKALRELRLSHGLRQEQVGQKIGLSADWVGKVEKAEIRLDIMHLILLCRIYEVKADEFVRRFEEGLPR